MSFKEKITAIGKYLFLAGIAFLIIRNNSYPFIIKRSSDILFFLSALCALFIIVRFKDGYQNFLARKNVLTALALICLGLIISSLNGYFLDGLILTKEGLLAAGRFVEVFLILFLVSFFQSFDRNFYKKAALAQLSTLVYLPVLIFLQIDFAELGYRFTLFENWASNVSYYLIVSITCVAVLTLKKIEPFKKTFFAYCALGIGLSSILFGTQTRAAWIGLCVAVLLMILFWAKWNFKKIAAGLAMIILIFLLGFSMLREPVKERVSAKIFPASDNISASNNGVKTFARKEVAGLLTDSSRLQLWEIYFKKLAEHPLGLGVNYEPVNIGHGQQGPHNTILEFLVMTGPFGLAGIVYLFFLGFKNLFRKIREDYSQNRLWLAYLFSSLAGLVVASMFDNMSTFRLMWLILGLAVYARIFPRENENVNTA